MAMKGDGGKERRAECERSLSHSRQSRIEMNGTSFGIRYILLRLSNMRENRQENNMMGSF